MKFGSVCSGIEAASVAWHPLGWEAAWLSEIEPFPSAVLAHHYPEVPNLGDMTTLPERVLGGDIEAPDVFCGGTPCQAFSVAGLRKSLEDARGNLSLTFCEIANAIDVVRIRAGKPAAIVFWENVPGVLSTKDNAFGCFLAGLAGEDDPIEPPGQKWTNAGVVLGPQRAVAWRVLDAQYFGVAQRRRRVFVVASSRDDIDPAAVLFEFDGLRRDSAPRRETGKAAPTIPSRSTAGGGLGTDFDLDGGLLRVAGTLTANTGGMTRPAGNANELDFCVPVTGALTAKFANTLGAPEVDAGLILPAQPLPITFSSVQSNQPINDQLHVSQTLEAKNPMAVAQPMVLMDQGGSVMNVEHDMVGTLRRETHGHKPAVIQPPAMQVRRLTPVECERLQGFPDGYTQIPWTEYQRIQKQAAKAGTSFEAELKKRGKVLRTTVNECPDGPRYKALGNSWAVPVVRWIGQRIALAVAIAANDNVKTKRRAA